MGLQNDIDDLRRLTGVFPNQPTIMERSRSLSNEFQIKSAEKLEINQDLTPLQVNQNPRKSTRTWMKEPPKTSSSTVDQIRNNESTSHSFLGSTRSAVNTKPSKETAVMSLYDSSISINETFLRSNDGFDRRSPHHETFLLKNGTLSSKEKQSTLTWSLVLSTTSTLLNLMSDTLDLL